MSLTSANAVVLLGIAGIFAVPQQIQGFAVDDIFSSEPIDTAEVLMGADAKLSAGWVPALIPWTVHLQGDSDSNALFETWYVNEQTAQEKFKAFGSVTLSAIGRTFTMLNGVLTRYPVMPDAKKIIQPRAYQITWEKVIPVPV